MDTAAEDFPLLYADGRLQLTWHRAGTNIVKATSNGQIRRSFRFRL